MNMHYPFFPNPMPFPGNNLEEEIIKIKQELKRLNDRIAKLEQEKKENYLKNDDSFYMM